MKRIASIVIASTYAIALCALIGCGQPATKPVDTAAAKPSVPAPAPAPEAPKGDTKPAEPAAGQPAAPAPAGKVTYTLSLDTSIIWAATVPIGTRTGGWSEFSGAIDVDGGNYETATVNAEVKMASVFSDAAEITQKMQGDEHFFQPGKFPVSTFKSTSIKKTATGFDVTGDLTIRDKTKSVVFPVTDFKVEGKTLTCTSKIVLNRHDFGIEYSSAVGDYVIKDECELTLDVVAEVK